MEFQDKKIDDLFKKNGYAIIEFYKEKDLDLLKKQFYDINPDIENEYFSTIDSSQGNKEKIDAILNSFFNPFIKSIFNKRKYVFGAFTVKQSGDNSEKSSHQDWSFVDETKSSGIGLWCPLNDVNKKNGCLGVLPGSHNYFLNYRGTNTRTEYELVAKYIENNLIQYLPMKRGQVLVFDNRIIHYSKPNYSSITRIVAGCATVEKGVDIVHYIGNSNNVIQKKKVDKSFFIKEDFSGIKFEKNSQNELITIDNFKLISYLDLFTMIAINDTRPFTKLKFLILSKFKKNGAN